MKEYKYVILGAGPTGLAFAHTLHTLGENSFVVLEANATAGGLCRSQDVDGFPLDIGGGHFLDVKQQPVLDLLFRFLPRGDWQEHRRISTIRIRGTEIGYPIESNLWQLDVDNRLDFLESVAQAGCVRGEPMPESFEKWISWKLGDRIAQEYMLPYNRKIWSIDLNALGTYWLNKLPDVSFRQTLKSCLDSSPHGAIPAHGVFLYPKNFGYGEVWKRMGDALQNSLLLSTPVNKIDLPTMTVNDTFRAGMIISSIPWTVWPGIAEIPATVRSQIERLEYASIDVDYREQALVTKAHWVYEPDESIPYHRILCRNNFSAGSRGYWTETNSKRAGAEAGFRYRNEYAYPINTTAKPDAMNRVLEWAGQHQIAGLGRWGTWEHVNSDVAVAQAIEAAKRAVRGSPPG